MSQEEYNARYDATIAKGLCFECGEYVEPITYSSGITITPVWCYKCKINLGFDVGEISDEEQ